MSRSSGLALPGERRRSGFNPSRAALAVLFALIWLPTQATLLPALGLRLFVFDPLLPLIAAFALGGRRTEAMGLAVGLGFLADSFTGVASGRFLLQYVLVAALAAPLHGHVVLRDRWVPSFGIAMVALISGFLVAIILGVMGAATRPDLMRLPLEWLGTGFAAAVFWPVYRRIAGWQDERSMMLGRRSM